MTLLAQINFEEVPDIGVFPSKGILEFFISVHDGDPAKQDDFRVMFFPEVMSDDSKIMKNFGFIELPSDFYPPIEKESRLSFPIEYKPVSIEDFRFDGYFGAGSFKFFERFG